LAFGVWTWGFCSYFQGIHRPWVAMTTTIVSNVFNIVASCILIFGLWGFPALGIRGAAWGTVLALAFQSLLLIGFLVHPHFSRTFGGWDTCRPDWAKLRQLLHIGWPAGLTLSLDIASWAVFNNALIGQFGTNALAGNTAAVQYLHIAFALTLGLGHATTALVGRYVGMGDVPRAKQRAYVSLGVAATVMVSLGLVFFALRYPLARHFSRDAGVVDVAATVLAFAVIFQGFRGLRVISAGALRGAGDTHWTAMVSVAFAWCVFLPLGWALSYAAPQLGVAGPWLGATIHICLLGATLLWRLVSERWAKIDIFEVQAHLAAEAGPAPREAP
jgi:MATE family multidrug resistance protein